MDKDCKTSIQFVTHLKEIHAYLCDASKRKRPFASSQSALSYTVVRGVARARRWLDRSTRPAPTPAALPRANNNGTGDAVRRGAKRDVCVQQRRLDKRGAHLPRNGVRDTLFFPNGSKADPPLSHSHPSRDARGITWTPSNGDAATASGARRASATRWDPRIRPANKVVSAVSKDSGYALVGGPRKQVRPCCPHSSRAVRPGPGTASHWQSTAQRGGPKPGRGVATASHRQPPRNRVRHSSWPRSPRLAA